MPIPEEYKVKREDKPKKAKT